MTIHGLTGGRHRPGTNDTVLGTVSGSVAEVSFSGAADASKLAQRDANGDLPVPATAGAGNYATGKTEVASLIAARVDSVAATITASTTQSQGQMALTTEINIVTVCANANDVVTLPAAAAGKRCIVANKGAETLQVFPASGDDLGAGADTSTTIAAAALKFWVAYDATNWLLVVPCVA
jgi:hypothetical protein